MKGWAALSLFGLCCCAAASGEQATPLSSVLTLLRNLVAQVNRDGEQETAAYRKFADWCDNSAGNTHYAVDVATKQKAKLEAEIAKLSSDIEVASSKIDELASSIAEAEGEANKAKAMRAKENADFREGEKELMEMIDALARATAILEKQGAAALAQVDTTNVNNIVQALGAMLDATSFPTSDRSKLLALVQAKEGAEEDEDVAALGAPQAAAYQSKGGNIVEVMEDMKEDAETQLTKLRHAESEAKGNYDLLAASLKDRLDEDNKELAAQKGDRSKASEDKATAEGDLQKATKDSKDSGLELKTIQSTCMETASDHEATAAGREEELTALEKAIQLLQEVATGGVSFVQLASQDVGGSSRSQVVAVVKRLAKKHHSAALAQLASRIAAAVRSGAADPFAKVKGMIKDMIRKLDSQGLAEAREKQYCDREMSRTNAKDDSLQDDVSKMTATIDSAASNSAELKEQVKELQGELSALAKEQAELDQLRTEQRAKYEAAKSDLEQALHGVRQALGVLRDYYGSGGGASMLQEDGQEDGDFDAFMQQPAAPKKHSKAQGAGSSLIEILELIESDFAENLAKVESQESDEQSDYEKMTAENKVTKASKEEDVKFMTGRIKSLDTTMTENVEDRETSTAELSAVETYLARLKDRCVAKPDTFEERAKRREAEIKGLKEALTVLSSEADAFLQRRRGHRGLRAHLALDAAAKR